MLRFHRAVPLATAALALGGAGLAHAHATHDAHADVGPYTTPHAGVVVNAGVTGAAGVVTNRHGSLVRIHAAGLTPGEEYGAHVHAGRCTDYLGHFRYDPAGPGTRENEIWLDLAPNAAGRAHDEVRVSALPADQPLSVVIHEHSNPDHAPGEPGHPGSRIACGDLG
jgi:Cu/Zn superoxide dismutase